MILLADEVGGNSSQKGDGHIGGTKYVVPKGCEAQIKSSNKDKHFTVLGLTACTGEPVMCVIIFAGEKRDIQVEMGIDSFASIEVKGKVSDDNYDFMTNNMGKD